MQDIRAIILNRSDRKFWYIRYFVTKADGSISKYEESTGVKKAEKTLAYMQSKFLPAWLARRIEDSKRTMVKSKEFNYFANIFLKNYEVWEDYQNIEYRTNRILAEFGKKDIRTITKLDIKQYLGPLTNVKTGKSLDKSTKNKYLRVFHGIFDVAVDAGLIDRNITFDIKLHERKNRDLEEIRPFSKEEVNLLMIRAQDTQYGSLLHNYLGIAFNEGMSPAEILGLQVGDIDLQRRTIKIRRNVTKSKVKGTKTAYRKRIIPIFTGAMLHIERLVAEARRKHSLWLFSKEDGNNLEDIKDIRGTRQIIKDGKSIKQNTKWYKLLLDCGVEYRDIKNCRHTFAVLALESNAFTPQQIANILGHSDLKMLFEHYAKWLKDKAIDADTSINLYESLINKDYKQVTV
ncbi:tyrosine-type recombinase/integrase [Sulfurospirillum halorespirans]|uniref:Integrase n=1 Tax=Sulfurospirillum halorespirans DSM 13726 TaxID=1193502 RepID=A0A1D7TIH3_9BACT|nr:tyrosine-type recombinase/integrase [Sulfurospirillum halorespirans]AOO64787.1 hypothetical protein SHALO_1007 [Sulfurospirillum halorespirans DSM 13726]